MLRMEKNVKKNLLCDQASILAILVMSYVMMSVAVVVAKMSSSSDRIRLSYFYPWWNSLAVVGVLEVDGVRVAS